MRPLIVDDSARVTVQQIRDYAAQHHYCPGTPDAAVPGDDPRHVLKLPFGYRAVFSFTRAQDGKLYRHLSVSVLGEKLPGPAAVWMLADEFGFTGWDQSLNPGSDWAFGVNEIDRCIVVAQEVRP